MPDCTACGHTIDGGDAFCRACGAATGVAPSPPAPPGSSPGDRWWLVPVVVAGAAAIAVVLGLVISFGPSADEFVGVWSTGGEAPISMTVSRSDDGLKVLLPEFSFEGEDVAMPAHVEGDALVFEYVADPKSDTSMSLNCEATLEGDDALQLTIHESAAGTDVTVIVMLQGTSGDSSASPIPSPTNAATDAAVKEGIHSLQVGIQSWAVDHNDRYPPPEEVQRDGDVGKVMDVWPRNPFSGEPMKPGEGFGDYTYTVSPDRTSFTLSGHLGDGTDFTVRPALTATATPTPSPPEP